MSTMTLDETLTALFAQQFTIDVRPDGALLGEGRLGPHVSVSLIGVVQGLPLGVDGALTLAHRVLTLVRGGQRQPILMLVDSDSQRMSRRDELLGLHEYLAHLAKVLWLADRAGIPTITMLYGGGAAGAFVATALATRALIALPGAHPAVMDLPSIARVTKLPLETLRQMSLDSPVFAPGLQNLQRMGAVSEIWETDSDLSAGLVGLLARFTSLPEDERDRAGEARGGRTQAASIAGAVIEAALQPRGAAR
jgi:malonate decarboxylase gamma subunit